MEQVGQVDDLGNGIIPPDLLFESPQRKTPSVYDPNLARGCGVERDVAYGLPQVLRIPRALSDPILHALAPSPLPRSLPQPDIWRLEVIVGDQGLEVLDYLTAHVVERGGGEASSIRLRVQEYYAPLVR